MGIQEPDKAIEVYEQALKRNPRDAILAGKMGQALIKTHQYGKAINYYKEAIRNDNNNSLRCLSHFQFQHKPVLALPW